MSLTTSNDLYDKVLNRIQVEKALVTARQRVHFYLASWTISVMGFILVGINLRAQMTHSSFFQFARLGFTDFSFVIKNFSDFSLSLIESLPIVDTAIVSITLLATGVTLFGLVRYLYKIKQLQRQII